MKNTKSVKMQNYQCENLEALNFINLNELQQSEILAMRNDSQITKWMYSKNPISNAEHKRFVESLADSKSRLYFAVRENLPQISFKNRVFGALRGIKSADIQNASIKDKSTKNGANPQFIGVISLTNIDIINKNATLGIYANPILLHKGYGTKLLKMLKFIAFDELCLHIIYAKVLANNEAALKFYHKNGFVKSGIFKDYIKQDGGFIDVEILYLKQSID